MTINKKKTTVVQKVVIRLLATILLVNVIAIPFIVIYAAAQLNSANKNYLNEVVSNISSTIDSNMDAYFHLAEVLATNKSIETLLEESSKLSPMASNHNINNVLDEMNDVVASYGGSVINVTILSVAEDTYIMSDGTISTRDTVTDRSYYAAVTQKQTIITTPYVQSQNNTRIVSTSSPVFASNGNVLGCVVVNIPTSFISQLISPIGDSGGSWVMDSNYEVLAHSNSSYIGQSYSAVGISGSEFDKELANPTGDLIEFQLNGVDRTGSVGSIPHLGWILVAGIDTDEFQDKVDSLGTVLFICQLVAAVIILVIGGVSIYFALKPMGELNTAMLEMSKGNLKSMPTHEGNDEIGELCDNLRTTMSNLDIYIKEIQLNLHSFANGDFTYHSDLVFLGDFLAIQTSTEDFRTLMCRSLASLKSAVEQVSTGSDYVATGAQNLAEGSEKQSNSVEVLNQLINSITSQIQENATNVTEVNVAAQQVSVELQSNNKQMDDMMLAMNDIQEKSEGIKKIVKTIEDVAFQTNILALNAAVEAARAGTAGKGFAVVAEEVRNLSTRTSEAVKHTSVLIEDTTTAVARGNDIANATVENLKTITEEINGFINTLEGIATDSEEQTRAIERINEGVEEISEVMQSNSAVSEESAATSEQLSGQASVMKEEIDQFKLV